MNDAEDLIREARETLAQHDRVRANTSNRPLPTVGVGAVLRKMIPAYVAATRAQSEAGQEATE